MPGSTQRSGQVHFNGGGKSVVADMLVSQTEHFCLVQITKGGSLELLSIQTVDGNSDTVQISGPLARGGWKGSPQNAPAYLKAFARLPSVLLSESGTAKREMTITEGDTRLAYKLNR